LSEGLFDLVPQIYILMLQKIFVDNCSSSYAGNMFTLKVGNEQIGRREEKREMLMNPSDYLHDYKSCTEYYL
jgi:hypothetical protein